MAVFIFLSTWSFLSSILMLVSDQEHTCGHQSPPNIITPKFTTTIAIFRDGIIQTIEDEMFVRSPMSLTASHEDGRVFSGKLGDSWDDAPRKVRVTIML
jgi:hypothetical protein